MQLDCGVGVLNSVPTAGLQVVDASIDRSSSCVGTDLLVFQPLFWYFLVSTVGRPSDLLAYVRFQQQQQQQAMQMLLHGSAWLTVQKASRQHTLASDTLQPCHRSEGDQSGTRSVYRKMETGQCIYSHLRLGFAASVSVPCTHPHGMRSLHCAGCPAPCNRADDTADNPPCGTKEATCRSDPSALPCAKEAWPYLCFPQTRESVLWCDRCSGDRMSTRLCTRGRCSACSSGKAICLCSQVTPWL